MMNLLLINYEYPPIGGGAATATWNMSRELVKQGHHVIVVTANYQKLRGWCEEEGVQVYRCRALRKSPSRSSLFEQLSFVISATIALPKILKNYSIEGVIVYFSMPCGPLGSWCKFLQRTPYVISLRGGDVPGVETSVNRIHYLLQPVRRLVLKYSQTIVANSISLKQAAQQADPFPVAVIPNGVDTDFFYPVEHHNKVFQFLFVGRFHNQKNLFFLLKQLNHLKNTITISFICHIVGDGYLKDKLQEYATKQQVNLIIKWHGWLAKEQIRHLYQQSDCLLNPSLYEGMPNVVLEAMACGLPVIASNVVGNDAVVRHNQTGYLFELSKEEEFQTALQSLLTNRKKARQFGEAGRDWVVKEFSWANVAKEYVQLFIGQK